MGKYFARCTSKAVINKGKGKHMNIYELEKILPNGFHDIAIKKMDVDFGNKSIRMTIEVDESGKVVELLFTGMEELKLNEEVVFNGDGSLWVTDFGPLNEGSQKMNTEFYFFISNLNAFLNFKIANAEII
jgi:hypothetical protein